MFQVEDRHWLLFAQNRGDRERLGSHLKIPPAEPWYLPPGYREESYTRAIVVTCTPLDEVIAEMLEDVVREMLVREDVVKFASAILVHHDITRDVKEKLGPTHYNHFNIGRAYATGFVNARLRWTSPETLSGE